MSVRAAVVIAAVVVAAFVTVVVVGADGRDGTGRDTNALVDRLAEVAGDPASVPIEAIEVGCAIDDNPTRLRFGGVDARCTLVVAREAGLGTVRVRPRSSFRVEAPAPQGDLVVRADAGSTAADEPVDAADVVVAVGEGTTPIVLICPVSATCDAELVP